jgi:hypothetical protein
LSEAFTVLPIRDDPGPDRPSVAQQTHNAALRLAEWAASHPAVDCPLATQNHSSDGGLIRGEAATIALPQVAPVDVAAAR